MFWEKKTSEIFFDNFMATLYMYIIHINDHVSCTLLGVLHRSQVHAARVAALRCLRFRPDGLLNVRLVGPPGDPLGVHPVDPPDDHPVGRLGDRFGDHPDVRRDGQELPKRRPPESSKSRMFSFWDDLLGTATGIEETQRLCKLL
jgi:hypothetical protein